ncbi:MAG: GNAT family N-acetyltransferase [Pseudomonadota bacterium]
MTAPIETARYVLRTLRADDADWITAEITNPRVQRWLSGPPFPFARADAVAYLELAAGDPAYRAIEAGGEALGVVSLAKDNLGYWLKEAAWGQGTMTEAATALVDWHFAQGGGPLTSGWHVGNDRSGHVLLKLGFKKTEIRREYAPVLGHDVDVQKVELAPPLHSRAL